MCRGADEEEGGDDLWRGADEVGVGMLSKGADTVGGGDGVESGR